MPERLGLLKGVETKTEVHCYIMPLPVPSFLPPSSGNGRQKAAQLLAADGKGPQLTSKLRLKI